MVISMKLPKKIIVSLIWSLCVNIRVPPPRAVLLPRCCRHRRSHRAAATALPPSRCALPPLPLTLRPPQLRRQAAANIPLSCCRNRLAATKLPPTSRFRAAGTAAAATALPPLRCAPPPCCCRRRAAADVALSRCCHRRRRRAAVHWLVVVLLSAVRFCHCMLSCHATINTLSLPAAFANHNL